ncbi:MAG: Eco47II family restriction endonuclease, partial [Candidatus Aenigmarchaeota archaeon]|nr:Eco47II family restriction endonuclease [Candidatus Aenigmarchaeota archaeon]
EEEWIKVESYRQVQKTWQNAIGVFHEDVLGNCHGGWVKLPVGEEVDVKNERLKIAAEIKNKFNTLKGNSKKNFRDEHYLWREKNEEYTFYYVEMLTKKSICSKNWKPKGCKTPDDDKIIHISGDQFYDLVTGEKGSMAKVLKELERVLPSLLKEASLKGGKAIQDTLEMQTRAEMTKSHSDTIIDHFIKIGSHTN